MGKHIIPLHISVESKDPSMTTFLRDGFEKTMLSNCVLTRNVWNQHFYLLKIALLGR